MLFSQGPEPNPSVVDQVARNHAAELLRRFAAGQITNDAFEDMMPVTADPAIGAIWDSAWLYYSDLKEHTLTGKYRLHPDAKCAWLRWLLFLDSDLHYRWPPIRHPGNDPTKWPREDVRGLLRRLFGLSADSPEQNAFDRAGHYPVWPFISKADYRRALRTPRRLSGRSTI